MAEEKTAQQPDLNDQLRIRREKLEELRKKYHDVPYYSCLIR